MSAELNYKQIANRFEQLLGHNSAMPAFLLFLKTRQRTSSSTDLLHITSFIRNDFQFKSFEEVKTKDIREILLTLADLGIGTLEGSSDDPQFRGRETFHWKHWIVPLYDPRSKNLAQKEWRCFGLEIKDIQSFKKNRNLLKAVKLQVDLLEKNFALGMPDKSKKYDVTFQHKQISNTSRAITDFTLEELTSEIERRGWSLKLERGFSKRKVASKERR